MPTNNNIPDIYRDNEHKVIGNLADENRLAQKLGTIINDYLKSGGSISAINPDLLIPELKKASEGKIPDQEIEGYARGFLEYIKQKFNGEKENVQGVTRETLKDMLHSDMARFSNGQIFKVNTEHDGYQLRLRGDDGRVLGKIKKGANVRVISEKYRDDPDSDRGNGKESHIFLLVEADAADTEAGGTGPVKGWVSTEYIQQLQMSAPEPLIVISEEEPVDWEYTVPEPPEPRRDILKPIEDKNSAGDTPAPSEKIPEKDNSAGNVPVPAEKAPNNGNIAGDTPAPKDKIPENANVAGDIAAPSEKIPEKDNSAGNVPASAEKVPENRNSAGNSPAPEDKASENGNTNSNTPGDIPSPKNKIGAPEANIEPQGLWSKFVSINRSIVRKIMSPLKDEIAFANKIANDDSTKI